MVTITDEEWDIAELRASTSLNKSVSDETEIEGGRVGRRGRSAGKFQLKQKNVFGIRNRNQLFYERNKNFKK